MTSELKSILLGDDPSARIQEAFDSNDLRDLEPALADLRMDIPAGYRHKDNFFHSLRALDRAIEREGTEKDLILRATVLFHDIGKPSTREFGKPGEVTFRNHEYVGARMGRKLLKRHGFTQADREQIGRLVSLHMRAYGFGEVDWTDSAVRRLETDAGDRDALDRLLIVFVSDLTTRNDKQRQQIEGYVARLAERLAEVRAKDERKSLRPSLDGNELMELTGLRPGKELGAMMKLLNRDENVSLTRAEALALLESTFPENFNGKN